MTRPVRDSGVAWIGDIPEGWAVEPFRRHFNESKEVNGSVPVGPMLSISGYRGVEERVYESASLVRDDDQLENYRVLRPGQLAVNTMWLNYAGLGVSAVLGHMSPAYRAYWISEGLDRRFVHHLLRSSIYVDGYTALLTGIRPNSLQMSRADLMAFPILVPPLAEQRAIADYLDRETARIDAFIAENEKLVGLLLERRAAIVTREVLRGRDAGVHFKETGIPWLGRVPGHWQVSRLSRWFEITLGKMLDESKFADSDGELLPYVRAANIKPSRLDLNDVKEMPFTRGEQTRFSLRAGDLLVVEGGSIGINAVVDDDLPGWGFQKTVNRVRSRGFALPRYLGYQLDIIREAGALNMIANVSTIQHLTTEKLERIVVAMPPAHEQRQIVERLEERTGMIDTSVATAREAIDLARERRAALISATVTGKVDVGVAV